MAACATVSYKPVKVSILGSNNGPYAKLFKIINFKGAGGPMFKTCQCAPYIAVMSLNLIAGSIHELCMLKGSLSP